MFSTVAGQKYCTTSQVLLLVEEDTISDQSHGQTASQNKQRRQVRNWISLPNLYSSNFGLKSAKQHWCFSAYLLTATQATFYCFSPPTPQ